MNDIVAVMRAPTSLRANIRSKRRPTRAWKCRCRCSERRRCQGSLYKSGRSRNGLKTKNPRIRQDVITLEKIANTGHRERRLRRDPANVRQRISPPRRATVTSDQELFAKGLATYQRVVAANYMAHEQVGNLLHEVLLNEAKDGFVFADLGCGTAPFSAVALAGTGVARYIGIDISKPSLDVARDALSSLTCPVEFRCHDFVEAIQTCEGPLDVVWIGQSLHHLRASEKRAFMRRVERLLPRDGLFLIWEPTCFEGEDRDGWMERFRQMRPQWPAISDEEFTAFDSHHRASDYAETAATWKGMAREAGFEQADELFTAPNQLARVYLFRH